MILGLINIFLAGLCVGMLASKLMYVAARAKLGVQEVASLSNRVIEENMALSKALHDARAGVERLEKENVAIVKRFAEVQARGGV